MNELALFAGAGGGILGGKLLGWRTVCAVEYAPYPRSVLLARQRDGLLPHFPIWDDVRTFDGKPWRGRVDVISGGFPCQGVSVAGKGKGLEDERSGLWSEMFRIICEVEPKYVFVENSPMLTSRGLGDVLRDLASMGYHARWGVLGGHHVGLTIERERIWILASTDEIRWGAPWKREVHSKYKVKASFPRKESTDRKDWIHLFRERYTDEILAETFRTSDAMAQWVDELSAVGNGQVPAVARLAWELLNE